MALDDELKALHLQHDIYGAIGCAECTPRTNVLAKISEFTDHLGLSVGKLAVYQPEGFGFHERLRSHLSMPALEETGSSLLHWDTLMEFPPLNSLLWLRNVQNEQFLTSDCTLGFIFDVKSQWLPFPMPKISTEFRMLELFSGSFGGWKAAVSHVESELEVSFQTVAVDHDPRAVATYSVTHCTNLLRTTNCMPHTLFCNSPEDWTVCADVLDKDLLKALCLWSPHCASVSSPCPPWSTSGHGGGLTRPEGMLLLKVALMLRWIQVTFILLEQVASITNHAHFDIIQQVFHWAGFRFAWYKTADMQDICRAARPRWLALLVRVGADTPAVSPQFWKRIDRSLMPNPTIDLPLHQHEAMLIPTEELTYATDRKYLRWKGKAWAMEIQGINVLGLRTYNGGTIPCFLARYGTQHLLDETLLETQGFHGHYANDSAAPDGCRHWHPAEIAVLHGICKPTFLPAETYAAWFGLGNMITAQHAMLPLVHMLNRCLPEPVSLQELLDSFRSAQYHPNQIQLKEVRDGYLVCTRDMLFTNQFLEAVEQLPQYDSGHDGTFWSPKHGIQSLSQAHWTTLELAHSQLTVSDTEDDDVDTQANPTFLAAIHWTDHLERFWYSGSIPGEQIANVWGHQFETVFRDVSNEFTLELFPRPMDICPVTPTDACIVVLLDSLMKCTPEPLVTQEQLTGLGGTLYDQFGMLSSDQKQRSWTLLLDAPLTSIPIHFDLVHLTGAFASLQVHWTLDFATNILYCHTEGPQTQQTIWGSFWNSILSGDLQSRLGRRTVLNLENNSIQFQPLTQGVCPVLQFRFALAVIATRHVLDDLAAKNLPEESVVEVQLILEGRPLWTGKLPTQMSLSVIFKALQITVGVTTGHVPVRLIFRGKQRMPEATLQDFADEFPVRFHVGHMLSGGGAKNQLKQMQQSALAASLLEHGFSLTWITPTVEAIVQKTAIQKLNAITALPMGQAKLTAIKKLCADHDIDVPQPVKPQTRKTFPGAPWQKKSRTDKIDPQEFTLVQNYFLNDDDTAATQINQIGAQANGICLLTTEQAVPWLKENTQLSSDELGMLVLGSPPQTTLPVQELTFPCYNGDGASVLLRGHLVQLGGKLIKIRPSTQKTVTAATNQLLSITLFCSDWTESQWQDAVHSTAQFIRRAFRAEGLEDAISALWGRSLRDGRAPASPQQASSIQMHGTVEQSKILDILKGSGFNKLFLVPKQKDGTLHPEYRVIWIGKEVTKAIAMSAQVPNCLGLVRGRGEALGLRFTKDGFDAAWKTYFPQETPPTNSLDDMVFRIQGLPFGCSLQMLTEWGQAVGWKCRPYKPIGPQTWLVKAQEVPKPDEIFMFNSTPVLITKIEAKINNVAKQTLLGPKSSKPASSGQSDPWLQSGHDPWAKSSVPPTNGPAPTQRNVAGPVEAKFQAREQEISQLRSDLTKLQKTQEAHAKDIVQQFQAAEQREQQNTKNVQESLVKMQQNWDKSLQHTMTHHTKAMDAQFQELKALFVQSKRKTREEDDADMSGSWLGPDAMPRHQPKRGSPAIRSVRTNCLGFIAFTFLFSLSCLRHLLDRLSVLPFRLPLSLIVLTASCEACMQDVRDHSLECQHLASRCHSALFANMPLAIHLASELSLFVISVFVLCCLVAFLRSWEGSYLRNAFRWKLTLVVLMMGCISLPPVVRDHSRECCQLAVGTPSRSSFFVQFGSQLQPLQPWGNLEGSVLFRTCLPLYSSCRVGEALHPGPSTVRIAVTNPTSIVSKELQYRALRNEHHVNIAVAAETAATCKGQRVFRPKVRHEFPKILWSPPVPEKRECSDGRESLRGQAAGVAVLSSLPIRTALATFSQTHQQTSRLLHTVVAVGQIQLQIIALYAYTPGGHSQAASFNAELLHAALDASTHLALPTLIVGDFNGNPYQWGTGQRLHALGFQDLIGLHQMLCQRTMPPTCRDATIPDNALLCPKAAAMLRNIQVPRTHMFDCHQPVLFDLEIDLAHCYEQRLPMPRTFLELPIDLELLPAAYDQVTADFGQPDTIESWGYTVEQAVDVAYRQSQCAHPELHGPPKGLPKAYRGRCMPVAIQQFPLKALLKPGRPADYNPIQEVHTQLGQRMVKQVRRIQSVLRGIQRPQISWGPLLREWMACLRDTSFQGSFVAWCQWQPEIGPIPIQVPPLHMLNTIYQMARHEVDMKLAEDHKIWIAKTAYRRHLDKQNSHKCAFALLRQSHPPVTELTRTVQQDGILVKHDDHTEVYLPNGMELKPELPVAVADQVAFIQSQSATSVTFDAHIAASDGDVQVTQQQTVFDPAAVAAALNTVWMPYWNVPNPQDVDPDDLAAAIQHLPPDILSDVQPYELNHWLECVRTLKTHSARGIDGISAAELKCLPSKAIEHLMLLLQNYRHGLPSWLACADLCHSKESWSPGTTTDTPHHGAGSDLSPLDQSPQSMHPPSHGPCVSSRNHWLPAR